MRTTELPPHPSALGRTARAVSAGLCLAGLLVFSGCQAESPPSLPGAVAAASKPAAGVPTEATLHSRIVAEIGKASCTTQSQCRTLALGVQACGGPQAWVAWSTTVSNGATLNALSEQLNALQRQRHAQSQMLSTCQFKADPGSECSAQQCVLRSAAAAQ